MRGSLEERFWAKVQKTDTCWIWIGAGDGRGYGGIRDGKKLYKPHRLSYELANGPIPPGMEIDHRCHNRACVNPSHLRATTKKQNMENRSGLTRRNTSGVHGVFFDKQTGKWRGCVTHNGRAYNCKRWDSIEDAEAAVIAKRNELFTHNDLDRRPS